MSRIGIIWVGFNCADTLQRSLHPWIEASKSRLGGHEIYIHTVCVPFVGYDCGTCDETESILAGYWERGMINGVDRSDEPLTEIEARGRALKALVEVGCTYVWQVDEDEHYTAEQITSILRFIEARPHVDWFRLCLRNAVFTPDQYLVDPFTPPRIHKVHNAGGFVAAGFHQDNNVYYERPWNKERVLDTQLSSVLVPKTVAWILHLSWLSDERSRRKVEYQTKTRGWKCSFSWDDSRGGLIFNPALPAPEIARDEQG